MVAKLDRLARNVAFISALMESGVKFVAVDLPQANELTVHIMATIAEYEAKAISARTKAALAAAKARGTQLGGLRWNLTLVGSKARKAALETRRENSAKYKADVLPLIQEKQRNGAVSLREIAAMMNADGTPARRGGSWSAVQVGRILNYSARLK